MPKMNVFRAGTRLDAQGISRTITAAMLADAAKNYDPKVHEAPIVIGHPKTDAPAYGWVAACFLEGDDFNVEPAQLDAEFAEAVRTGRYKKVSASFYLPGSPAHPIPGSKAPYLRHIGFLGATPPAVKGLRQVEFAESEEGVVTFEEALQAGWGLQDVARLFRTLKNWLIQEKGVEVAETVLSEWALESIKTSGDKIVNAPDSQAMAAFAEEQQKFEAEFAEREAVLAAREAKLAEEENKRHRDTCAEFVESLVKEGRVLPRDKVGLVAVLAEADAEAIDFAEKEGEAGSRNAWLRFFLSGLPVQVDFGERAPGSKQSPTGELTGEQLGAEAADFMEAEKAAGRTVSATDAVEVIKRKYAGI